MKNKIRLVGGPAGGKVIDSPDYGRNEIVITGPKKMTRRQKMDYLRDNYDPYSMYPTGDGKMMLPGARFPMVEARYRISKHPQSPTYHNPITGHVTSIMPCMHPDGSIFYEYVEGSKRELTY